MDANRAARVAVVIPSYKVERHIAQVIRTLPDWIWAIIVVDDCSPDELSSRVCEVADPRVYLLRHAVNQGVGGAMLTGYKEALRLGADIVVKMDGDGQMDPAFLPALLKPLLRGKADYAKGNRWIHTTGLDTMPSARRWGSVGLSFLTKLASGYWRIFDPCNGYTALRVDVLRALPLDRVARDYFFETSMLVELNALRALVVDVPMPALYGAEVSSMRLTRILFRFPPALARAFTRRVIQRYFVRSFEPISLFLLAGLLLAGWGVFFGSAAWIRSLWTGIPATAGTVMLSSLPLLMGFQLLLQAGVLEINDQPQVALCQDDPLSDPSAHPAEFVERVRAA